MNNGNVMGVFIGLESATYEYIANIIAPYQANFVLEIGDFLLIENMGTYIVSRVTEYRPTGEQSITEILDGSGIPVHQLYASIEMAKNWKLVSTRIDKSSYPNRNLIWITEKGSVAAQKLKDFLNVF